MSDLLMRDIYKNFGETKVIHGINIEISDETESTAALALQGPNSLKILNKISSKSLDSLKFFWLTKTKLGDFPVTISRTGYTGDLGYEIWLSPDHALQIWKLLLNAGKDYGITPTGLNALDIARVEASLILLDVDYISSRHALVDNRKSSPYELGLGWAVKLNDQNNFIGKKALMKEYSNKAKWKFVGIEIEWDTLESQWGIDNYRYNYKYKYDTMNNTTNPHRYNCL